MKLPKLPIVITIGVIGLLGAACGNVANPEGWAAPVFDDDGETVYYFPDKGRLDAIAFTSDGVGSRIWTFPDRNAPGENNIEVEAVYGEPLILEDRIYFAGWEGEVYSISANDGRLQWTTKDSLDITGSIVSGLAHLDGVIFAGTTEGRVYALNAADGSAAAGWPQGGVRLGKGIWAPPVVANGQLFVANMDGELYALAPQTGTPLWTEPFKAGSGAIPDLALLDDNVLWVPTLGKRVYFVDITTGREVSSPVETADWVWTRPATDENRAFFGDFGGLIHALDITTWVELWETTTETKVKSSPVLIGDTLVLADRSPAVVFLNAETGQLLNRVPLLDAGTVRANLVAQDGVAYVLTTRGRLYRADPERLSVVQVPIAGAPD